MPGTATTIKFGDYLNVTDEGDGAIRVDACQSTLEFVNGVAARFSSVHIGPGLAATDLGDGEVDISAAAKITSVTTTYTILTTDDVIFANGTFTVTLPTALGVKGKRYTIKNTGTGTITVARTSSQTIDGAASNVTMSTSKQSRVFVSDGSGWQITEGYL